MKKKLILGLAILLIAGLFMVACENNGGKNENSLSASRTAIVGDFSLTVTLDKTEVNVGDTVTATVVFKNLSGKDIEAELPDWIASGGGRSKEDILDAVLLHEGVEWAFIDIAFFGPKPKILIESGDIIERQFELNVTEKKNFEVHAGAFFITPDTVYSEGMQAVGTSLKIKVR